MAKDSFDRLVEEMARDTARKMDSAVERYVPVAEYLIDTVAPLIGKEEEISLKKADFLSSVKGWVYTIVPDTYSGVNRSNPLTELEGRLWFDDLSYLIVVFRVEIKHTKADNTGRVWVKYFSGDHERILEASTKVDKDGNRL